MGLLVFSFLAVSLSSCVTQSLYPDQKPSVVKHEVKVSEVDIQRLYGDVSRVDQVNRNPVVVIPDMMGSRLQALQSERIVWGASGEGSNEASLEMSVMDLALPMKRGATLLSLSDDVVSAGTLDRRIHVAGDDIKQASYTQIMDLLEAVGYRDVERAEAGVTNSKGNYFTSFQFDYDWRRDIVESARALDQYLKFLKDTIEQEIETRSRQQVSIRFNLVAHGTGGLVARYYLRYGAQDIPVDGTLPVLNWAGADVIESVVFVGTPQAGSLTSLKGLLDGYHAGGVSIPASVLGTMPAMYQLMPRYRHATVLDYEDRPVDILNALIWKDYDWGLLDPAQDKFIQALVPEVTSREERFDIALEHVRKSLLRAKHVHEALDIPAKAPEHLHIAMFTGDAVNTLENVRVENNGDLKDMRRGPGDGQVTRASALMDERQSIYERSRDRQARYLSPIDWDHTTFIHDTRDEMVFHSDFVNNFLFTLMEAPQDKLYLLTGNVTGQPTIQEEVVEELPPAEPTLDQSIEELLTNDLLDWDMNKAIKNHRSRARKERERAVKELWVDMYPE